MRARKYNITWAEGGESACDSVLSTDYLALRVLQTTAAVSIENCLAVFRTRSACGCTAVSNQGEQAQ